MARASTPSRNKSASPGDKEQLDFLVSLLVYPEEARRQEAVSCLLLVAPPVVRAQLIRRLLALLKGKRDVIWARASASLEEMGQVAVPGLLQAISTDGSVAFQLRALEVLGRLAHRLPPEGRVQVQFDLTIVQALAKAPEVAAAAEMLTLTLRPDRLDAGGNPSALGSE